jgi:hypothetical protein
METLSRRDFLTGSTVVLLLVPVACSSSGAVANASEDASACDGVFEISTVTNDHTHSLCVPSSDLASPPAAGTTYTTSLNDGHTHTVTLTQTQLQTIASGGTVTVTTSSPAAHNFTIQKS